MVKCVALNCIIYVPLPVKKQESKKDAYNCRLPERNKKEKSDQGFLFFYAINSESLTLSQALTLFTSPENIPIFIGKGQVVIRSSLNLRCPLHQYRSTISEIGRASCRE